MLRDTAKTRITKAGLIYKYSTKLWQTKSHCQYPCPVHLNNSIYRVFFGSRTQDNNTMIFYFDFDAATQSVVNDVSKPVLTNGPMGYFDSNGIYPSSIIKIGDLYYMYTLGFMRGEGQLYYTRIGLATSYDLHNFKKFSSAPLMNTSQYDPWMLTGPFVMQDNGIYRMWYVSGDYLNINQDGILESSYNIKYAESKDGLNWTRNGLISINHIHEGETNIARPWVIKEHGIYKAWYSYSCNKGGYQIGYAESSDGGYTFERLDHLAGIEKSSAGWENNAVAYPSLIQYKDKKFLFYNGNQFGKDGIGLAIIE